MSEISVLRLEVDRGDYSAADPSMLRAIGGAWDSLFDRYARTVDIVKGFKTYLRRASKLAFLGYVVDRPLGSTKELSQGEAIRILRWLIGQHPSPRVSGDQSMAVMERRRQEVIAWLNEHEEEVTLLAKELRVSSTRMENGVQFHKVTTAQERRRANEFLARHNQRGCGSTRGYVAYYAASVEGYLVAVAKFCPLHTPQAAKFFAGDDWKHVYCLQRLAACGAPKNLLSAFLAWCLRQMGRDPKVHYVATYADSGTYDPRTGCPHTGGVYRATNAVYCGKTKGGRVEGFVLDGQRHSMRCGRKTWTVSELRGTNAKLIRARPMHRYCWAVGPPLARRSRRRALVKRMAGYRFEPVYQPLLLLRRLLWSIAPQRSTPARSGL